MANRLPHKAFANLGTRSLHMALDRLNAGWQERYGHPVVLVETFVDLYQFYGTVYTANGWQELGWTDGFGRVRRDFFCVQHDKPKRLFARELCRNVRGSLATDKLKPDLAAVEAETCPLYGQSPTQICSMVERFKSMSDYRRRIDGSQPPAQSCGSNHESSVCVSALLGELLCTGV